MMWVANVGLPARLPADGPASVSVYVEMSFQGARDVPSKVWVNDPLREATQNGWFDGILNKRMRMSDAMY